MLRQGPLPAHEQKLSRCLEPGQAPLLLLPVRYQPRRACAGLRFSDEAPVQRMLFLRGNHKTFERELRHDRIKLIHARMLIHTFDCTSRQYALVCVHKNVHACLDATATKISHTHRCRTHMKTHAFLAALATKMRTHMHARTNARANKSCCGCRVAFQL